MRIFLFLFVVVLLGLTSFQLWMTQDNATSETVVDEAIGQSEVQIGGPFTLTDQYGNLVQESEFRGRLMLVFFGFTHCPDICPVTVNTLSRVMELLGDKAEQVAPIFITVDPKRDTPDVMKAFLENFDKRLVGLTGSAEDIAKVEAVYKAYAAKVETTEDTNAQPSEEYTMDHSAYIYLMDKNGKYSKIFSYTTPEQDLARVVEHALE